MDKAKLNQRIKEPIDAGLANQPYEAQKKVEKGRAGSGDLKNDIRHNGLLCAFLMMLFIFTNNLYLMDIVIFQINNVQKD